MPFLSSNNNSNNNDHNSGIHTKRVERAATEGPYNDRQMGTDGISKTRSHNLVSRIPTGSSTVHKPSEKLQSSASSIKSSTKTWLLPFRSSHKKKESPSSIGSGGSGGGGGADDAVSIFSAAPKLERTNGGNSDNVSINSDSSSKTTATATLRKKFGLLSSFKR